MHDDTVFVSHSTHDQPLVERFVQFLESRCQGAIRFFVAVRDLESGEPWEENVLSKLTSSKLMLAVFSANALQSSWVIFEAGFARGRNTPVIPLALPGQSVATLPRPLGSLQGFNLHASDGLQKVIEALNARFGHAHPCAVEGTDFQAVLGGHLFPSEATPPPAGAYHVYSKSSGEYRRHEALTIQMRGEQMTAEAEGWRSTGLYVANRYVGRFRYLRGTAPSDLGIHEFHWTGKEFVGRAQGDSAKWKNETLVWRPDGTA